MPKAVLITSHFWNSKRKAGFHNIADSLLKKGYEVLFLTGNASFIHHLKGDYRARLINRSKLNKIIDERNGLKQFIRFTFLHPVNYRSSVINRIIQPSVREYSYALENFDEVNEFIEGSEFFIFESFPGLLWFRHFKRLNPIAKFVYRVSDDLSQLRKHPYVIEHERIISYRFDLISAPSQYIYDKFAGRGNVRLHHHGIRKDLFDAEYENPYKNPGHFKFVFTGSAYFDKKFLKLASQQNDSNGKKDEFHIIGRFRKKNNSKVIYYGELDFKETIPFIRFADCGLHTLDYSKGAESFSDSLKVIQYTYCRLPVISPEFIKSSRNNFIYYKPGDKESIAKATALAKEFDRDKIDVSGIESWDEVTERLIQE